MEWIYPFLLLALPLGGPLLCVIASRKGTGPAYAVALGILGLAAAAAFGATLRVSILGPAMVPLLSVVEGGASMHMDGLGTVPALLGSGSTLRTRLPSPAGATTTNLAFAGFAVSLLIWSMRDAVYRLRASGLLIYLRTLAKRELHIGEACSPGSGGLLGVSRLSPRIATGNAAHHLAYLLLIWACGAVFIAGGLL